MALSADGRFSLSVASRLGGTTGLAGGSRNWRLVKFFNGEFMGKRLNVNTTQLRNEGKAAKQQVRMSLTANIAGESKVSYACSLFLIRSCREYRQDDVTSFIAELQKA